MAAITQCGDGSVRIAFHVAPRAKNTGICGMHGDALKVRLQAPPVDGKANRALCEFVAESLSVPKADVTLVAGDASRDKIVQVRGVSADAASKILCGS